MVYLKVSNISLLYNNNNCKPVIPSGLPIPKLDFCQFCGAALNECAIKLTW